MELPTVKINQHNLGVLPSQDNIQITPETNNQHENKDKSQFPDREDGGSEWKLVKHKKRDNKSDFICTGTKKTNSEYIRGAQKRKWVYVGRVAGQDTSEEDIINHLKDNEAHGNIEVKKLNTKGKNAAFSVGVPSEELFKAICNPEMWPEGIKIREFSFIKFFRQ